MASRLKTQGHADSTCNLAQIPSKQDRNGGLKKLPPQPADCIRLHCELCAFPPLFPPCKGLSSHDSQPSGIWQPPLPGCTHPNAMKPGAFLLVLRPTEGGFEAFWGGEVNWRGRVSGGFLVSFLLFGWSGREGAASTKPTHGWKILICFRKCLWQGCGGQWQPQYARDGDGHATY